MEMKKAGFTLLEMIIVVALITVILGITTSMFITGNKVFSNSDVKSTLQIEAQAIQENISKIGMESIGIDSITDEDGENSINDGKNIEIVNSMYEKLESESKLTDIDGNNKESKWLAISAMTMNSYEENNGHITDGNLIPIIEYVKNNNKKTGILSVNGKELSSNVKSIRIKPINIEDSNGKFNNNGTFKDTNSVLINIELEKEQGFSDVIYPISIQVEFRNNFIKQ